jgi:hypothetical protein
MSKQNGDRARFQKDRKRKMLHRQRIQALVAALKKPTGEKAPAQPAEASPPATPRR